MGMKKCISLIAMGVGGTLLYQNIRNGNAKRVIKDLECNMKKITSHSIIIMLKCY